MARKKKKMDHLTRDVLEAEKAGMSYGKWKAQNPHTYSEDEDEPAPSSTRAERTCIECGAKFCVRPPHANKVYCSDECRVRYGRRRYEARRRNEPGSTAICPICGISFLVDHTSRVYCSRRCSAAGNRQQNAERKREEREAAANGSD